MQRIDTRNSMIKKIVLVGLALILAASLALYASLGRPAEGEASPAQPKQESRSPDQNIPKDKTLLLTVPKMERVRDLPVYTGVATDEATLAASALRVKGTGLPWQEEANVYIAGHRLGFEGEKSYRVFYDLDVLRAGDEVILTDANGTRYTYRVFTSFTVGPNDYEVTEPTPGKNIVSLQTCTLPDFAERFIVQAELTAVTS